jgi:hypothetical protein
LIDHDNIKNKNTSPNEIFKNEKDNKDDININNNNQEINLIW